MRTSRRNRRNIRIHGRWDRRIILICGVNCRHLNIILITIIPYIIKRIIHSNI
jgi:hypothetical protein